MDGATFARVLDVARWVRDELEALGVDRVPKTSGASGLHVYIPLPPRRRTRPACSSARSSASSSRRSTPSEATVERT
jgi:bifunctional non-homologous end joining protein LigD